MFKVLLKRILVVSLIFHANTSVAYNSSRCNKKVGFGGNGIGLFISTSSYISSTGPCSAIGKIEDQKKHFIAHNLDRLIIDSSKGVGEYLSAYLLLSGCNSNKINETGIIIQKNLQLIYGTDLEAKSEESYKNLNILLMTQCRHHKIGA